MKFSQKWKQTTVANRLLVYTGAFVAARTLFYAGAAVFQVCILNRSIRQQAEQTDRLIAASERMANTGQAQTNLTERSVNISANTAQKITEQNERAISATEKQANASLSQASTSKIAASAARDSASIAKETLRPILSGKVDIHSVNEHEIVGQLVVRNDGGKPTDFTVSYCPFKDDFPNPMHTAAECGDRTIVKGPFFISPHADFSIYIRVRDPFVTLALQRKTYLFFLAGVTYSEFGQRRQVPPICYVYREDFQAIGDCSDLTNPEDQNPQNEKPPN